MVAVRAVVLFLCLAFIHAKLLNMTCEHIRQFVDGHNKRRLQIAKGQVDGQPATDRMTMLLWDTELAAKAAKWAQHNNFSHNPDRTIGSKRFKTGENLYIFGITGSGSKEDRNSLVSEKALESWFEEHKHYEYEVLSAAALRGPVVGHYTQMVWANSVYLGCAVSQYEENGWHKYLVVCNYGPPGNMLGENPYESGRPSNTLVCGTGDCSRPYGDKSCVAPWRNYNNI